MDSKTNCLVPLGSSLCFLCPVPLCKLLLSWRWRPSCRVKPFSVIYSGNIVQADVLKCLLEGAGIETILRDEFVGMIAPWYVAPGGAGAVKVLIGTSDIEQALPIVEDFMKSKTS